MSTKENTGNENTKNTENSEYSFSKGRREALKTLATVPVLGAMAYGVYKKSKKERTNRLAADMFHFGEMPEPAIVADGEIIRLGVIGVGIRGIDLMQAIGFATPEHLEDLKRQAQHNSGDSRYKDFM